MKKNTEFISGKVEEKCGNCHTKLTEENRGKEIVNYCQDCEDLIKRDFFKKEEKPLPNSKS